MDPIAGGHATFALLLALEYRRRTGKGMLVEAIMVGGALNIAAEQVIEYSAYGNLLQRQGNHGPRAVPQNLYLSADILDNGKQDRWVAIAVENDAQWQGLVRALGSPQWATDPGLASTSGRRAAEAQLDEQLSTWCRERSSDDIVSALWEQGVPVSKVLQPHEMGDLPPLEHRHFYETVDHPLAGPSLHEGYPVRFSNGPHRLHRSHAPMLGEHNREVFCGLLGVTDEEFEALERDAVIGDRIEGSFRSR
jgi:crotonobetainyl-CoA:carnitine CoA-transferase CaiB-like acyl-CoA transferase